MQEGEELEEAAASPGSLKQRCACCLLILLLIAGGAGLAFSTWRSQVRSETNAVRARLLAEWGRPDLHTPAMKPEVDQLLEIAIECDQLQVSDALHNLRGSPVTYVRAALKDPTSTTALWETRQDGRLWIWSRGPDRLDNGAALSERTVELEKDYPTPILEQDPGSNVFGEEDVDVDLVRAVPLGTSQPSPRAFG